MAVIRWNPFNLSSIFEDDFDMPTLPGISRLGQGLNLYETEEAIVAEAAVPGISEDHIDVTIEDGVVRITGSVEEKESDKKRHYMKSVASSYNYSFRLPEGSVKDNEPTCELENGILKITFEKPEKTPPKKIQVRAKAKKV